MSSSSHTPLSPLTDPASLAKLQILLIPIQSQSSPLPEATYTYWRNLLSQHTILRGDELRRPNSLPTHHRGSNAPEHGKSRFFPNSNGASIARTASANHVHLSWPSQPPAKHLYPLSLLRMAAFPLVVIGICVDEQGEEEDGGRVKGYELNEEDEGDLGEASTPLASHFSKVSMIPPKPSPGDLLNTAMEGLFPSTSPFPLVKRMIMVSPNIPTSPSPKPSPRNGGVGVVRDVKGKGKEEEVVKAPEIGHEAFVGRLLGEVVGEVLGELGDLATAMETPSGLKTLSSTLLPSLTATLPQSTSFFPAQSRSATPTSDAPSRPSSTSFSQSLDAHTGMGITLTRALTPGGRPTSVGPPSLPPIPTNPSPIPPTVAASSNPFRRSTALSSPFTRSTSTVSISSAASSSSPITQINGSAKYTTASLTGVAGGRLMKLLGDMYLLAGMYGDAIRCFDDGAERCRGVGDVLWEGLAREGRAVAGIGEAWEGRDGSNMTQSFPASPIPVEILSHYQSAFACLSRAPLPYPPTILSPSPQAVSGSISFSAPSTLNPAHIGTGEGLLAWLHTGLSFRTAHFQLIIWASGGWGSIALSSLLSHSLPRSFPPSLPIDCDLALRRKRQRTLSLLSASSQLLRSSIFLHAESALGPHHRALTKVEQLQMHVEAVWLARYLELPRKEAGWSREVVKRLAALIVEGREEGRKLGSAGLGKMQQQQQALGVGKKVEEASVGLGLGMAISSTLQAQAVGVRRRESVDGNAGVIHLLKRILNIMGVDLLPLHNSTSPSPHPIPTSTGRYGWPELQVESMKEAIAISESLPDHINVIRLCTSALKGLYGYLNPQSQAGLARMYPSALGVVKRRGMEFAGVGWWFPGKTVLSLELASLSANRLPFEHSREEIVEQGGKKDPFLYNPRSKATEAGKMVLVANEQTDIFLTLQNPLAFELDIQDLSLITTGVALNTNPLPMMLPPTSVQTVRLSGIAPKAGDLQIKGVRIRLSDGSRTEILLPVPEETDGRKKDKRKSLGITPRDKRRGVEARWSMTPSMNGVVEDEEKWLECKIVEEMPLLWIKKSNLTHGTIMLYNGESSVIRVTLENSSSVPVNFLKLSFDDSSVRAAQVLLNEGELSAEGQYEVEWDVLNRPVFTCDGSAGEISIPPGGRYTVSVNCLGKVGCTDGTIRFDYGYIENTSTTPFHTRQITFPILFTVYHTLELHSLDIIRFPSPITPKTPAATSQGDDGKLTVKIPNGYFPNGNGNGNGALTPRSAAFGAMTSAEDVLRERMGEERGEEWCLVGLCFRNVYGVPFEVELLRKGEGDDDELGATRLVPPGATERLILPMQRKSLTREALSKPVPSLSARQYVVEKTKKSAQEAESDREVFWYREELLGGLVASWSEPGSRRYGSVSLRDLPLSPELIEVYRKDELEISLSVDARSGGAIKTLEFVDVTLSINNHSDRPIRPHLRIEPLPSSPSDTSWAKSVDPAQARRPTSVVPPITPKNIIIDGSLTRILDVVQPGEKGVLKVGVMFMASGGFGFRGVVEEVNLGLAGEGKVRFSEACLVDVV